MAWYNVVWCDLATRDMWRGVAWCGMVWRGVVWCDVWSCVVCGVWRGFVLRVSRGRPMALTECVKEPELPECVCPLVTLRTFCGRTGRERLLPHNSSGHMLGLQVGS
jgi:hypothetical protein